MPFFRPATPGFIVTLTATILLAIVSFSVPLIKSVYFLKATLPGFNGSLTFGTLGYCLQQASGTTCSKASVGYQIDINTLLGNNTSIQIPSVIVKWITYCLVLHIVAFALAGVSAIFGLLAHVSEFAGTCCSTCVAGFSAAVTFLAFIFDIALFFLTKSRINKVAGGSATTGNAIWLTLAAWILLLVSGFFYCFGSCCVNGRPSRSKKNRDIENEERDQMRLDAVKAEADRKARAKMPSETGLPAFQEYQPLNLQTPVDEEYYEDGDHVVRRQNNISAQNAGVGAGTAAYDKQGGYAGGYVQAPVGTRAVDEYYAPANLGPNSQYPPQRQSSTHTAHAATASSYSAYSTTSVPPPVPQVQNQYMPGNHYHYPSAASSYQPGAPLREPSGYNPATSASNYYDQPRHEVERSYTLGGSGYGTAVVPDQRHNPYVHDSGASTGSDAYTVQERYDDNPPVYDENLARPAGAWASKS